MTRNKDDDPNRLMSDRTHLLRELRLNFLLQSAQQEGAEHLMKATDDQDGLLLVKIHLGFKNTANLK